MKSDGFVLILCLCFVALVSSMALSALLVGLLSQKIAIAGQQQMQQLRWAKAWHLLQKSPPLAPLSTGEIIACPAEFAIWSEPATRCHLVAIHSEHQQYTDWSSLLLATELTLPQEAL